MIFITAESGVAAGWWVYTGTVRRTSVQLPLGVFGAGSHFVEMGVWCFGEAVH